MTANKEVRKTKKSSTHEVSPAVDSVHISGYKGSLINPVVTMQRLKLIKAVQQNDDKQSSINGEVVKP